MRNYIKLTGMRKLGELDDRGPKPRTKARIEELFFFDDADPVQVSAAQQRAQAYRDRHPGIRLQISIERSLPGLSIKQIGYDMSEYRDPAWWQGAA